MEKNRNVVISQKSYIERNSFKFIHNIIYITVDIYLNYKIYAYVCAANLSDLITHLSANKIRIPFLLLSRVHRNAHYYVASNTKNTILNSTYTHAHTH